MRSLGVLITATAVSALPAQAPSREMAQAVAAYAAKVTASAIFVSGRTLESVVEQEFAPIGPLDAVVGRLLKFDVDRSARRVTCRLGVGLATAVYHEGLGCSLVRGPVDPNRRRYAVPLPRFDLAATGARRPWPAGDGGAVPPPPSVDRAKLASALALAFAEPDRGKPRFTRAVLVVHRGELIAERYAAGFHANMPLPGWSMSKTLTNALVGVHVGDGSFDVEARPFFTADRREEGDVRALLRNRHLLGMSTGLTWSEDYDEPESDALRMLLFSRNHAARYAQQPAQAAPGTTFQYSSGATNVLCEELRIAYNKDLAYWQMPARFFERVGMRSAVLETDPDGTFVGSSYCYATARDWARLGLLYLQDGVMFGERILPAGWVSRSTARDASPASDGRYGWQLWLNLDPDGAGPRRRRWPALPNDLFHMSGHEGQYVVMSPSAQLVIVRLGCSKRQNFPLPAFLGAVHEACR